MAQRIHCTAHSRRRPCYIASRQGSMGLQASCRAVQVLWSTVSCDFDRDGSVY
jgi:hypothetical protein